MPGNAVFLVTGPSAAGKSTVGRLLAERLTPGAYLEGDFFRRSIVAGRLEMTPDASREALAQLRLRYRLAADSAAAYFDEGFNVVLEDVAAGPFLPEYVERIRSRPLHVVVLIPSVEAVAEREASREGVGYHSFSVGQLHEGFVKETPRIGLWLDSSEQTPQQTVDEILARSDEALVPA